MMTHNAIVLRIPATDEAAGGWAVWCPRCGRCMTYWARCSEATTLELLERVVRLHNLPLSANKGGQLCRNCSRVIQKVGADWQHLIPNSTLRCEKPAP